jgi:ActR/RegA family two-component response regulator
VKRIARWNTRSDAPMHVMLLSTDLRFRRTAALLLARRGCAVSVGEAASVLLTQSEQGLAEVVVIDGGRSPAKAARIAAAVQARSGAVGVVLVGERAESQLDRLHVIPKWGPFETLFAAVEQAMPTV